MMRYNSNNTTTRGFNLLELMIVVTIIGLLVAAMVVAIQESRDKAYNKALIRQVDEMVNALEIYFTDTRSYPSGGANPPSSGEDDVRIYCIGDNKVANCIPGADVVISGSSHIERVLAPQYLARIPHTEAGPYSSLAYHRCTSSNPSETAASNSSCRGDDFSIWYVLKGNNRDCGRGQPAPDYSFGGRIESGFTLCRMQATK
jgi:prepilin-type N-terminal cleavage/methylation domain-containing protein